MKENEGNGNEFDLGGVLDCFGYCSSTAFWISIFMIVQYPLHSPDNNESIG